MSSSPRAPLFALLVCCWVSIEVRAQNCANVIAAQDIRAEGPCDVLAPGNYRCDPETPVQLSFDVTKSDPALPLCFPVQWSLDGSSVTTTEPRVEHTFSFGQAHVNARIAHIWQHATVHAFRGFFEIAPLPQNVPEDQGHVDVVVRRTDARFAATIDYSVRLDTFSRVASDDGTISFAAGELEKTFQVRLIDDDAWHRGPTNVVIGVGNITGMYGFRGDPFRAGTFTVVEDDQPTDHAFASPRYSANEADETLAVDIVRSGRLDIASTALVRVDGRAVAAELSFAPGETRKTAVLGIDDGVYTGDRTLHLVCTAELASGQARETAPATLDLIENEPFPTIGVQPSVVTESNRTESVRIPITITPPFGFHVAFDVEEREGTALADQDYVAGSAFVSHMTFFPNAEVFLQIVGDRVLESNESLTLVVRHDTRVLAEIPVTITDDELPFQYAFSATRYDVAEAAREAVITVQRTGDLSGASQATLQLVPPDEDQRSGWRQTKFAVPFAAGAGSADVRVPLFVDSLYTGERLAELQLVDADQEILARATLAVADLETKPTLAIEDLTVNEPDGATDVIVKVRVSGLGRESIRFNYTTADGTATAPADYTHEEGTGVLLGGNFVEFIRIRILGDSEREPAETFTVRISNCCGDLATLVDDTATVTIRGDEDLPTRFDLEFPARLRYDE
ncbi:MAG TPA: Calx-beta domain-containing protein, partial [Vicinamibacterales bacterium]|nr:Calx-beta domain-containing protein [Vicinamibacterales bacterium]